MIYDQSGVLPVVAVTAEGPKGFELVVQRVEGKLELSKSFVHYCFS